jgi:subtilase family serine protease
VNELTAIYPGTSPNVLTVGGTSLYLNADNSYSTEIGWSGSGGGISTFMSQPSYQAGIVCSDGNRSAGKIIIQEQLRLITAIYFY